MGSDAVSTSRSMRAFEFYGPAFAHWLQEQNKGRPIRWEKVEPDDYTRAITQSGNRKIPITVNGESRNPEIRHLPAEAAE